MSFKDIEYAVSIWTPNKIAILENGWEKQKPKWHKLIDPFIPETLGEILDVGCGIGMYYDLLAPKCKHYIGIDPVNPMIKRAMERRPSGDWRIGSIYKLPFPNNHLDLVFCWSVLIHLPHETIERALEELWRVTRKHLLFNLYISLDEPSFSIQGSWGEYLTAMDEMWMARTIRKMNPKTLKTKAYEPTEKLGGSRFQRYIYFLEKGNR